MTNTNTQNNNKVNTDMNAMFLTDGYKAGHIKMYPENTEKVYSTWVARSSKYMDNIDGHIVFGIQYLIKDYIINYFNENFFKRNEDDVVNEYKEFIKSFLGEDTSNVIGIEHIRSLHKLGYLPIEIRALQEGVKCPVGMPSLTIINTIPEFFWVTNYLETIISNTLWLPFVSSTTAYKYKKELMRHLKKTGGIKYCIPDFNCHDFSMRGMSSLDATISSGMAHLTSFSGSESIPAIVKTAEIYNDGDLNNIGGTVSASEHSIECSNTDFGNAGNGFEIDERAYIRRMLDQFPTGFLSIVCDGFDFFKFVQIICTEFKDEIMNRNGRVVLRPDSGNPVRIIAGDTGTVLYNNGTFITNVLSTRVGVEYYCKKERVIPTMEQQGVYEILWNTFGGIVNEKGYKVLDPHIGVIYGDSITPERQREIYERLETKGFSATNLVLGIGSYTYQYKTRDSLGLAMKATWCKINGQGKDLFKDPKTVCGMPKKSLRGLVGMSSLNGGKTFKCWQISEEDYEANRISDGNGNVFKDWLEPVFKNGKLLRGTTIGEIRQKINNLVEEEIQNELSNQKNQ